MSEDKGRSLSRHEFDAVIRRAAELASSDSDGGEGGLTEVELFRIAREVGLSERHVRTALSEVRMGQDRTGIVDRIFGPALIRAVRVVPGDPPSLSAKLDDFLAGTQLLQPVRRAPGLLQYRPALDWASQIARAASFTSRKYYVASAKSVEVTLEDVGEEHVLVEITMDPGTRGDSIAGSTVGGVAAGLGAGGGLGFGLVAAGATLALAVPVGAAVGVALVGGIAYAAGMSHKKKLLAVQAELEGILDRLETGESLEPPPSSWRKWVKRQFHGVARDLMSAEDEPDEPPRGGSQGSDPRR